MSTKYALFLTCSVLMSASIFGTALINPALAGSMAIQSSHDSKLKSTQINVSIETVTIDISGTASTCAQVLFIRSNGDITYLACIIRKYAEIPDDLTKTLFKDIHIALPLNTLPKNRGCLKSTSFGSSTYMVLNTQKSPDISCSVDSLGKELYTDVRAIQAVLHTLVLPPQRSSDGLNRLLTR